MDVPLGSLQCTTLAQRSPSAANHAGYLTSKTRESARPPRSAYDMRNELVSVVGSASGDQAGREHLELAAEDRRDGAPWVELRRLIDRYPDGAAAAHARGALAEPKNR